MEQERDAATVNEPSGEPPDSSLTFDPEMTDADEANNPPESAADPDRSGGAPTTQEEPD